MWKEAFECLSVDEKVRRVGVSLASACDCCESRQSEDLEHVLNKGKFAADIWRKLTGLLEGVDFSIKHSYREGYRVANALARQGAMGRNNLFINSSQLPKIIKEETDDLPKQLTQNAPPSAASMSVGSQSSDINVGTVEDSGPGYAVSSQTTVAPLAEPKYRSLQLFVLYCHSKRIVEQTSILLVLLSQLYDSFNENNCLHRHGYYQKPEEVVVTIYAKGIPAKNLIVDFGEQILSVSIDISGEDVYHFQPRLFGKIVPEKCRYEVLSTKVEIRLVKAEAINWTSLEFTKESAVPQKINVSSGRLLCLYCTHTSNMSPNMLHVGSRRPTYPSSKSRAVDWNMLEAQVKKEVESNGTVQVGKKKVEGTPPDGMELKKREY
ncbi:hypothetical protein HHK36_000146 [Tetracentron sinense]|uniref:Protein SGT1 homolog n=1 Tax=Tetracentron sinense TaxID=13715 RepID=A0A835DQJ5_TETSI|nr:hypothetical protein HHK36_000146 [Tetracentron sinense]